MQIFCKMKFLHACNAGSTLILRIINLLISSKIKLLPEMEMTSSNRRVSDAILYGFQCVKVQVTSLGVFPSLPSPT